MNALYRCTVCGGSNVWILDWCDPNAGRRVSGELYHEPGPGGVFDYAASLSHTWCDDCGDHLPVVVWSDTWAKLEPIDPAELAKARSKLAAAPRHHDDARRPVVVAAWVHAHAQPQLLVRYHDERVGTQVELEQCELAVIIAGDPPPDPGHRGPAELWHAAMRPR